MMLVHRKLSSLPIRRTKQLLHLLPLSQFLHHPFPRSPYKPYQNPFSSKSETYPPPPPLSLLRGGCYPDDSGDPYCGPPNPPISLPLCPGCGVHMQSSDHALPGYFSPPSPKSPDYHAPLDRSRPILLPFLPLSLKSGALPQNPNPNPNEQEDQEDTSSNKPVVCARCHSLRYYGRVKNPSAENLLPDFDFDRMVAPKMLSPSGPPSLVLLLVDSSDFHGSFPTRLAALLSSSIHNNASAWKERKPANIPRALLILTKCDLLPPSLSPQRLHQWARQQVHQYGSSVPLAGLHLVSAVKDWGVRDLVDRVRDLVGSRGSVWAVGSQNAGKSTLINAMGKCSGGKTSHLTEAPVPGTTLGIIRVEGVLGGQVKLYDTPGMLHPNQISTRLTREEQKLVHVGKELRPRTYRIKAGHSIHIGGLMRVDVEESSAESIYLTVWASALLPLHMGRTENASKMIEDHFGRQLQPPIGEQRVAELGRWTKSEFCVRGNSWDANSVDIAVAGLGWVAVGLKGDALLGVWTYDGADVISRSSLISERARTFEEAGFTVSKIVSQADSKYNKFKHERKGKKRHDLKLNLPPTPLANSEAEMTA